MDQPQPPKPQVVIVMDDYGLRSYYDKKEIDLIEFDFKVWRDEIPDRWAMNLFRTDINKVRPGEAKDYLELWYKENNDYLLAIEESEALKKAERAAKKAIMEEEEVKAARALLESRGLKVE